MVPWWGAVLLFLAGMIVAFMIIALVSANDTDDHGKWWDNDGNL
jgi:hypothetical protein